jgi:hypothetical protein
MKEVKKNKKPITAGHNAYRGYGAILERKL